MNYIISTLGHPGYMYMRDNTCRVLHLGFHQLHQHLLHSWNILMVYVSSNKGVMQHYYRRVLQRMLQQ